MAKLLSQESPSIFLIITKWSHTVPITLSSNHQREDITYYGFYVHLYGMYLYKAVKYRCEALKL